MRTNPAYSGMTFNLDGMNFVIHLEHDEISGPPWEECDGHGEVTKWTCRGKGPGEMMLCEDSGDKRYYDFAGAVQKARDERWGAPDWMDREIYHSNGAIAHDAALADFEYLRAWCNNDWEYVYLTVTLLDEDGDEIEDCSESLGGVENINREHVIETARELAYGIIARYESMMTDVIGPDKELNADDQPQSDRQQAA